MTRDWRDHWRRVDRSDSDADDQALRQVGKTVLGAPVDGTQLDRIVERIERVLGLSRDDHLIDLGCGNGLLTHRVSPLVASICGVDISPPLVADARTYRSAPHIRYSVGDIAGRIGSDLCPHDIDAAYSYEVLQHLTSTETAEMLRSLAERLKTGRRLFLGSIPDVDRIRSFYDTPERWSYYEERRSAGTEQIGTWWSAEHLAALASAAGFDFELVDQPADLYTAHYRFDALLTFAGP